MVKIEKIPTYSLKKLKKQVKKTRKVLALLEAELEERKVENQHEAIDNLEEHLDHAGASLLSIAGLMTLLKGEEKSGEIIDQSNKEE